MIFKSFVQDFYNTDDIISEEDYASGKDGKPAPEATFKASMKPTPGGRGDIGATSATRGGSNNQRGNRGAGQGHYRGRGRGKPYGSIFDQRRDPGRGGRGGRGGSSWQPRGGGAAAAS